MNPLTALRMNLLRIKSASVAQKMRCARFRCTRAAALAACLLLAGGSRALAQENVGPLVYTVGTTWHEAAASRDWAYLLWLGSDASLIGGQSFAVYAKPGPANSASPYQRIAITGVQTDTRVIQPLVQRAGSIGEDLAKLEVDIDALFGKIVPAGLDRAEKISAVIRGALADPNHYGKVILLARTHPSMAMSLGVALAEPIGSGQTTFEIRQIDSVSKVDIAVIGRVTVQAGAPTVLPPPGAPVQVPRAAARGDLNIQLRWATPDPLRRLSLLQHGYNVYRVRQDYAEHPSRNWHVTPPSGNAINAALSATTAVRRVNSLPLLSSKLFTLADVGNFIPPTGDSNTVFITDVDDRGKPGYVPTDFVDGAKFYYFVAARDLLGRDGTLSPGTSVMVCDQLPPHALRGVEVLNDYVYTAAGPQHFLRVNWPQPDNGTNKDEQIKRYWIYRWTNINEIQTNSLNPLSNLVSIVNHDPLKKKNTYLDNGPNAPNTNTSIGRTYWYTLRAEDAGSCSGNLSPHSAPVPGVLRDRRGPAGPTGGIRGTCLSPAIVLRFNRFETNVSPIRTFTITVHGTRVASYIQWMEMRAEVRPAGQTNVLASFNNGQHYFVPGVNTNDWVFTLPSTLGQYVLTIYARCGSTDGKFTGWNQISQSLGSLGDTIDGMQFDVIGGAIADRQKPCGQHHPTIPGSNNIDPIDIDVVPTLTTREMRLYRRVDDGPLTLICQKTNPPNILSLFTCQDDAFPPSASEICYYAMLLDEHGNPSPLVRLGCITVASPIELPRPMLSPLVAFGNDASPAMVVKWFCPPAGVERFEVGIAGSPEQLSDDPALGLLIATGEIQTHTVPLTIPIKDGPPLILLQQLDFKIYRTPRIGNGSSFGSGAQFDLIANVAQGSKNTVFVKAVGKDGTVGDRSNIERLTWAPPSTNILPTVEWPDRPLPAIANSFKTNFAAAWMTNAHNAHTGAVVLVGLFLGDSTVGSQQNSVFNARPQRLHDTEDPMAYLYKRADGTPLFPVVLYRHQTPSAKFPTVSGDIIQCSPMMESIAFQRTVVNTTFSSIIHDPFIVADGYLLSDRLSVLYLFLKDTQPVISGASYKYLLVRFQRNGEIAEVIPTNEVDVP
jgi:hypothetical protein